ncbi:P-loop NTPase fold protein [Laspinema palackyanum]|uniref:P-loop NTPase fold protein n=1 Tax=Laspinema palackyanum TaxID=3231601 RepID=UPI00345D56A7|nr:KAP family NTPase [Laspinema sp. D2c]
MTPDIRDFYRATEPGRALVCANPEDRKYYIDFSTVRGGEIIDKLKNKITFFMPDRPTCALFTGHIGCGKSTELLRLKMELEKAGFHVVYFASSDDLELTDVDIVDVLLAIASRISHSLESIQLLQTSKLKALLQDVSRVLNADIQGIKAKIPKIGDVGISGQGDNFTLSMGIGEITAQVKQDASLRKKLNQFLGPQKQQLLDAINQELIEPAIAKLKEQGKQGLVAIVDNLDRLDNSPKFGGKPQQEYLFVDQGEYLSKLNCHLVYTLPLALKFSNSYGMLTQRFEDPKVLPMVPVRSHDGSEHQAGMALLRQMVLARAFPDLDAQQRLDAIPLIFDSPDTLDRLCQISGGHVRDLLKLLNTWIMEEMQFPLGRQTLETVIQSSQNDMIIPISESEWELLREVKTRQQVNDDTGYQQLIRSRFVFEYRDNGKVWFDVNPILAEAGKL